MADKQTPLMRQYYSIKKKHPGTILLFRLGDFFETFEDDAVLTAKTCGITLTKRNNGGAEEIPLAGFPHHQLDNYLPKLVRAGYRVAVCEQIEDPKHARGIVRRDVVEVVTPGVAFNEKLLDSKSNNYLLAIVPEYSKSGTIVGVAGADISTGEFFTTEIAEEFLADLVETLSPTEILVTREYYDTLSGRLSALINAKRFVITRLEDWIAGEQFGREALLRHFKTVNLKGFGVENLKSGVAAAGMIIHYISETQRGQLPHIRTLSLYNPSEFMMLDVATKRNLEIIISMNPDGQHPAHGTLIHILDKTETAMGGRLFKKWMTRPLRHIEAIQERQEAVLTLLNSQGLLSSLRRELLEIGDIERLIAKISTGRANPRDLKALQSSFARFPGLRAAFDSIDCPPLQQLLNKLPLLEHVTALIQGALNDDPPAQLGGGGVFREGYSTALDEIRQTMYSGKNWIAEFQERERNRTGISSLKVGFNNVFGYYIEITHAHKAKIPDDYDRKQTLTNAERYTTPELKEMEQKILTAEERLGEVEKELFQNLRLQISEAANDVQLAAQIIARLDCLQSFAEAARLYDYSRPEMTTSGALEIQDGRHPVVERLLPVGEHYIANSTAFYPEQSQIHIITGPNMSGKSSYLRQVGLITLLAHVGAFVPARKATITLVDRIFTRVGAQDNISAGESTFLVEMQEAANILHNATPQSLILLDEVGRGTATFDGISIAWAIVEYLHEQTRAKTLFATHYHELTSVAEHFPRIVNYKAEVRETGGTILFTRNIIPGTADHSFGIHVAEMAGLPQRVTRRASEILQSLETQHSWEALSSPSIAPIRQAEPNRDYEELPQLSLFEIRDDHLRERLRRIDVNSLTPIQALQLLHELHQDVTQ